MTEPSFVKVLEKIGRTMVNVVNIEFNHITSPGSGETPSVTSPSEPPSEPDEKDSKNTDGESGSASGDLGEDIVDDDDFESSSVTISIDIYRLLLACIAVLGLLHLVNNS